MNRGIENMKRIIEGRKYIWITANLLLIMAIGFFLAAMFGTAGSGEANIGDFGTKSFNENWSVVDDTAHQNITLPVFWDIEQDTTIILENILPEDICDGMSFCMRTSMHDYTFYVNGALRETYRSEEMRFHDKYLPSAYVVVELCEEDAGKVIQVKIEAYKEVKINEAYLSYGNNIWFDIAKDNLPVAFAAFVLIVCGALAFLFSLILKKRLGLGNVVLYLGQVMVITGCWILSESKIRQLFFNSPSYTIVFSFLFIEIIACFVAMYFNEVQKYQYNTTYVIYEAGVILQAVINICLDAIGLVYLRDSLILSHVWLLVGGIIFIITCYKDYREKRLKNYSIIVTGMVGFVVFCIIEATNYYVSKFPVLGMYLCIGLVVLLATTVVQTINDEMEKMKRAVELERAKEEAESANRAKSQFLARVSHEIRTPVNAVIGLNEMIFRESGEEGIRQYAQDVKNVSTALLDIINELLDASKIESGVLELVETEYEIGTLLNELYQLTKVRIGEKNVDLVFLIESTMPKAYCGDDRKIRQILMNLLTNAIKYTESGSITLSVNCEVEGNDAKLFFSVKDTGIGIKAEDIGILKDAFKRVDIQRNRYIEGTGLGLNIVNQYLALMNSELEIQSEYEKGSEFSFIIIQKIVDAVPLGDYEKCRRAAEADKNYVAKYQAPNAKILVVDDHKMNLKVFTNLLKQTKMQITEAESGRQGLGLLEQQSFDMVFLDHMMPGMDGIETLHEIKKRGLCEDIPVIMLTANALVGNREKYLKEGFDDFLSKPILPGELDNMILRHLPAELLSDYQRIRTDREEEIGVNNKTLREILKRLPELDGQSALQFCGNDEAFYLELLQMFVSLSIKEELEGFLNNKEYEGYGIRVHAFKNNAYSVGAKELGDDALEMEKLAKQAAVTNHEEDIDALIDKERALFDKYDRICKEYAAVVTAE